MQQQTNPHQVFNLCRLRMRCMDLVQYLVPNAHVRFEQNVPQLPLTNDGGC